MKEMYGRNKFHLDRECESPMLYVTPRCSSVEVVKVSSQEETVTPITLLLRDAVVVISQL
jgi:hypothetical protein